MAVVILSLGQNQCSLRMDVLCKCFVEELPPPLPPPPGKRASMCMHIHVHVHELLQHDHFKALQIALARFIFGVKFNFLCTSTVHL